MVKMKRTLQAIVACLLLGSLVAQFAGWRPATTYVNGLTIPASDIQLFALHCNNTPEEFGEPYEVVITDYDLMADLTPSEQRLVTNGVPGTYWCSPKQFSTAYNAWSIYSSSEQSFTVTVQTMGFVPNPPW